MKKTVTLLFLCFYLVIETSAQNYLRTYKNKANFEVDHMLTKTSNEEVVVGSTELYRFSPDSRIVLKIISPTSSIITSAEYSASLPETSTLFFRLFSLCSIDNFPGYENNTVTACTSYITDDITYKDYLVLFFVDNNLQVIAGYKYETDVELYGLSVIQVNNNENADLLIGGQAVGESSNKKAFYMAVDFGGNVFKYSEFSSGYTQTERDYDMFNRLVPYQSNGDENYLLIGSANSDSYLAPSTPNFDNAQSGFILSLDKNLNLNWYNIFHDAANSNGNSCLSVDGIDINEDNLIVTTNSSFAHTFFNTKVSKNNGNLIQAKHYDISSSGETYCYSTEYLGYPSTTAVPAYSLSTGNITGLIHASGNNGRFFSFTFDTTTLSYIDHWLISVNAVNTSFIFYDDYSLRNHLYKNYSQDISAYGSSSGIGSPLYNSVFAEDITSIGAYPFDFNSTVFIRPASTPIRESFCDYGPIEDYNLRDIGITQHLKPIGESSRTIDVAYVQIEPNFLDLIEMSCGEYEVNTSEEPDQVSNTTGIGQDIAQNIKFYPNPTNKDIIIETGVAVDKIFFVSVLGKEQRAVYQQIESKKFLVDVGNLMFGVYYLKIHLENGAVVYKELIKE